MKRITAKMSVDPIAISCRSSLATKLILLIIVAATVILQTCGSGVFQVRLESDNVDTTCVECNATYRLCLGHYRSLQSASNVSASSSRVAAGAASSADRAGPEPPSTSFPPPVCTYGTLTTRAALVMHPQPAGGSQTAAEEIGVSTNSSRRSAIIDFPFAFTWPVSFTLVVESLQSPVKLDTSTTTYRGNGRSRLEEQRQPTAGRTDRPSSTLVSIMTVQDSADAGEDWRRAADAETSLANPGPDGSRFPVDVSYRVRCDPKYFGPRCAMACNPRHDKFGHYDCSENGSRTCLNGWTGKFCDLPICRPGCHPEYGYCEVPNECRCRVGWQGDQCDQCKLYPGCQHGTCQRPWQCTCLEGWGGLFCNQDLKFCSNNRPCRNGATCHNTGLGSYTCSCAPGFNGTNCENDLNGCPYTPCLNNGTCIVVGMEKRCKCPLGFAGRRCEMVARTCETNPCYNGATCLTVAGSYRCTCAPGYTGFNCDINVDECLHNPCLNGGTCMDAIAGFRCLCSPGFSGDRCEVDRDECAVNPCLNGGRCVDRPNDFECRCLPGFVGALCQDDVDECLARPCANGATCRQLVNDFRCTCAPGFTGRYCTENIDDCASEPCRNGATCIDRVDGFVCRCSPGFVGLVCEKSAAELDADMRAEIGRWRRPPDRVSGRPLASSEVDRARLQTDGVLLQRAAGNGNDVNGGGAVATLNAVQPLLLVASFGLALPIIFVACAFAVWIHRRHRRMSAERFQRNTAAAVSGSGGHLLFGIAPEMALNNRRQLVGRSSCSMLMIGNVEAEYLQQQSGPMTSSSPYQLLNNETAAVVDSIDFEKSMKNNCRDQVLGNVQGQGRSNASSARRLSRLQCHNNIGSATTTMPTSPDSCCSSAAPRTEHTTGSGNLTAVSNVLWTTSSSKDVAALKDDVTAPFAGGTVFCTGCRTCSYPRPATANCSSPVDGKGNSSGTGRPCSCDVNRLVTSLTPPPFANDRQSVTEHLGHHNRHQPGSGLRAAPSRTKSITECCSHRHLATEV